MNATGTGIGRVLRKARENRGKSVEEASRETRIRAEYLHALERETFGQLLGDVYVRGFLRSYASYLGLDPEDVLAVYNRSHGTHQPTTPPAGPMAPTVSSSPEGHPLIHRRANWRLAVALAGGLLALVAVVALVARSGDPGGIGLQPPPSVEPSTPPVTVNVVAQAPVDARVVQDGHVVFDGRLARGEARSFQGEDSVEVSFADGAAVSVTVNGHKLGHPGAAGQPYEHVFGPDDFRRSPSNGG
ncbi:MAG: helix-turn-helix domain-containing protein [Actinobacteria bacterium]|nr:helix-turn-helix domain-containing protein [Actinomycetota bacterium]